jgi:hypothetical protein
VDRRGGRRRRGAVQPGREQHAEPGCGQRAAEAATAAIAEAELAFELLSTCVGRYGAD